MNAPAPVAPPDTQPDAAALAQAWRTPMLRFALLHLQPPEEAEDAVQDALLALLDTRASACPPADAGRYLFGILKHKITDRLRRKYRSQQTQAAPAEDEGALDALLFDARQHWQTGAAPAAWHCPESHVQNRQFLAVVDACVHQLPPKIARVFSMKTLLECEAEEICTTLGLSKTDYWQCMSRARKQLQLCLNQRWFDRGKEPRP